MADISKIKLPNNTTYDIKDVSARSAAATAQSTADGKISSSLKGIANGVAELDANGLVPTSQLPSYVDDVLEYATKSVFPTTGESGKIYVDISTNLTYRWSGTAYVEISPSLALGETSSTAYRGDRGKTAYAHATDSNRLTTATAVGLYKVGVTTQGHVSGLTAVAKADITALGIPAQDTTYSSGTGITISGTTINHSNSVTAGTAKGDDTKTLSFGGIFTIPTVTYDAQGHITAKGTTTMTMPSNPNTDRYVNSAAFANDTSGVKMTLTRAGSDTATVTGTIPLVSSSTAGVAPKGAAVSSQSQSTKFLREDGSWAAPSYTTNTNTTYTIGTSGNNITLTPSSGDTQSITAPYATSAGSATKATQDGSGNTITSTYVKKSGDTMTGELKLYREGTTTQNLGTYLTFQNKDTTTGKTSNGYIVGYDGGENGINLVINPAGNMFIGSGEAGKNHYDLYTHNTGENFYATSDTHIYLQANGQTIANRVGMIITNGHTIVPCKADVTTNNTGSIGTSSARWAGMYAMKYNGLLTGTGTAGQDKGSGTTNRYVPAKWTFNIGSNTVGEGDLFVIKLPVAGHDYGTYLSLNNGTNYYPVIYNTSTRLTSHFPVSSCIIVTFDSAGSAGSIFPLNGGDARTTVSGGAFRVVDFYDSGNSTVNQTATTGNANYEVLFSGTADNTTRNEGARKSNTLLFNPSTGTLTTKVLTPNKTLADSWINCGKNPNIYINNTNAAPWITGNTKNGRIALCSYVSNDDKLYFNYWTNTTLAGTENKTDKQMTWDASTGTLTTATFVGALTGHASSDLALSGGTMTGNINFPAGKSIYSKDSANRNYALIYDNGNNLWIGATSKSGNHHTGSEGSTYISAGYNTTNSKGNNTIYVSVPTLTGSTWGHTAYAVLHVGNTSFTQSLSSGTKIGTIKINGTSTDLYCQTNTNTHRPIQVDGTEVLGNNTTALNLVAGTNVSLSNNGGAVTITATDTNNAVAITNTNPTTGTWYYPVWHSSTSATSTGVRANDGFRYYSLQGTTSAAGRSILQVGNGTQTGTAGNKYGEFRIYSQKQGYSTLTMASGATTERKHSLPDVAGTIGVFTATPTSGKVVVADGTAGGIKTSSYSIGKSVPSDAVFTDTNDAVEITTCVQTGTQDYYPVWSEYASGIHSVLAVDSYKFQFRKGTTSTFGLSNLILGNGIAEGTDSNQQGKLKIFGKGQGATEIVYDSGETTGVSTQILPTGSGTILTTGTTSFTQSLTSGTKIGTIKINNTDTDLYCQNDAVTQTKTTTNATYDILFSSSTTNTDTKTEGGRKSPKLSYNPSTGQLKNQGTYSACNTSGVETSYLNTRVLCLNTNKSTSDDYYIELRYGSNAGSYYTRLRASNVTGNRDVYFPSTSGTIAIASSDIRLKENVTETEVVNATSVVNQIKLHSFDWKTEREPSDRHWKIGVIADELEEIDPRFTLPGTGGYNMDGSVNAKTVDTFYMMGYLIKTIQELSAEIDELKKQIK